MTPQEMLELRAYEERCLIDGELEYRTESNDFVPANFRYVKFTSRSKGKNRLRTRPIVIELVRNSYVSDRWQSWHKIQWDLHIPYNHPESVFDPHAGCWIEYSEYLQREVRKL